MRKIALWLVPLLTALALAPSAHAGITISMGDSYSSGEANGPYDAGTDDGSPVGTTNRCHRSGKAWPRLLGVQEGYHFACSGAKTENLFKPQHSGPPDHVGQLNRLADVVKSGVGIDRIYVTLGGNDLGFSKIIRSCRFSPRRCLGRMDQVDLPLLRGTVRTSVTNALRAIRATSLSTQTSIVLVGYPDIIPDPGKHFEKCRWIDEDEETRLNELMDELDKTLNLAARDAGERFLSIRGALSGHELCSKDPWVKPVTSLKDRGIANTQQMAHPTAKGQQAMAAAVRRQTVLTDGLPSTPPPGCQAAGSVAAIVDDSGSMDNTDPLQLRRRAMELLITKPGGEGRTLGALEFGSTAAPLFAPTIVAGNQPGMVGALAALAQDGADDDGGATNYNAAFDLSKGTQPDAGARIFLTDGGHNVDDYEEGHAGGPRTYVIGLDVGSADSSDVDRLQRIAAETGGGFYDLSDASQLQPVVNSIDALLACRVVPDQLRSTITKAGTGVAAGTGRFLDKPAIEVVLSWSTPGVDVDLTGATVRGAAGRVVADLKGPTKQHRKRGKLATSTVEGATFDTITIARPTRGSTLAIRVGAGTVPGPVAVDVQIRPADQRPAGTGVVAVPTAPGQPAAGTSPSTTSTPTVTATPTPAPTAAATPAPPPRKVITVDNRVTNGMGMREDATPVRLTTQPWVFCGRRGCNIGGTERTSGQTYDAAVCQVQGERTTNGQDNNAADDANPSRFESTRYYGVRLADGRFGYVSEVWITAGQRGGLGLPGC